MVSGGRVDHVRVLYVEVRHECHLQELVTCGLGGVDEASRSGDRLISGPGHGQRAYEARRDDCVRVGTALELASAQIHHPFVLTKGYVGASVSV
jgi:hypothetical protein